MKNFFIASPSNHPAAAGRGYEAAMNRTKNQDRRAVTLMEVLASIFVISIGLLGVLAVIPFGAFQVAQGRNAEHTANMLAAAGQDVKIMDMVNVETWAVAPTTTPVQYNIQSDGNKYIYRVDDNQTVDADKKKFNCMRFYIFDPFDTTPNDPFNGNSQDRFFKIGRNFANPDIRREMMTGQDDLVYTVHKNKRTDFSGQGGTVASSGRYTWFLTFSPPNSKDGTDIRNTIDGGTLAQFSGSAPNTDSLYGTVTVDLLGCYNRVPGDSTTEREVTINTTGYTQTLGGAQMTLNGTQESLDLTKTKYIFVIYNNGSTKDEEFPYNGLWCKVVYAPKNVDNNGDKTIVVTNPKLPATMPASSKAVIIDGVLYHKRVDNVTLF